MVTVENAGNGNATLSGSGGGSVGTVDYQYEMGKHEVTSDQHTEFLNAVASTEPRAVDG